MVQVRLDKEWTDENGATHAAGEMVDVDPATLASLEKDGVVGGAPEGWAGPTGAEGANWAGPTGADDPNWAGPTGGDDPNWAGPTGTQP